MKTLIFDFDGTIADSFVMLIDVFENITHQNPKLTPAEIQSLRGQSLRQILKYFKIKKWQMPGLLVNGRRGIAERIGEVEPFTQIPSALKSLHQNGVKMFILSTNSPENIAKFLKANELEPYFSHVYGNVSLVGKPRALKKLLKAEKLTRADCVYVGDEVRDIHAAKKTGIPIIAVGWGFNHAETLKQAGPDSLILQPKQLISLVHPKDKS